MSDFPEKKRYEDVRFNVVISVTRGVGGCQISGKKRYVTLEVEWPLSAIVPILKRKPFS